jgi:hypothetical protein
MASHRGQAPEPDAAQHEVASAAATPALQQLGVLDSATALMLQRSAGNAAVSRLVAGRGVQRCACGGAIGRDRKCERCSGRGAVKDVVARSVVAPRLMRCECGQVASGGAECNECQAEKQAATGPSGNVIVADAADDTPAGIVSRSTFLDRLGDRLVSVSGDVAGDELRKMVQRALAPYRAMDAATLERAAIAVTGSGRPQSGEQLLAAVVASVQKASPVSSGSTPGTLARSVLRMARSAVPSGRRDPGDVTEQLGGGEPLAPAVRSRMARGLGGTLPDVTVHRDEAAAQVARSLNARALAVGDHIAFAPGEYQPGTVVGDALLAHELAHVIQQRGGQADSIALSSSVSAVDSMETAADAVAASAVLRLWAPGTPVPRERRLGRASMRVQNCSNMKCPDEYCWQVTGAVSTPGACLCTWECRAQPTAGPSADAPGARRGGALFVPDDVRYAGGALGAGHSVAEAACSCYKPDDSRGTVCQAPISITPTTDTTAVGPFLHNQQGHPDTTEPPVAAEVVPKGGSSPPSPGGGGPIGPRSPGGPPRAPVEPPGVDRPPGQAPTPLAPAPPTPAGPPPNRFSDMTDEQVRAEAMKDPAAVDELITRYNEKKLAELDTIAKKGDGTAAYVASKRRACHDTPAPTPMRPSNLDVLGNLKVRLRRVRESSGISRDGAGGTFAVSETDMAIPEKKMTAGSPRTGSSTDDMYKPPNDFPSAQGHAEQNLAGKLNRAIVAAGLDKQSGGLDGKTVWILVEQEVCQSCKAGLYGQSAGAGVLKQFSKDFPALTIEILNSDSSEVLRIRGGQLVQ